MQVSLDIIHVNRIKIVYYSEDADALVRGQFGTN